MEPIMNVSLNYILFCKKKVIIKNAKRKVWFISNRKVHEAV